MPRSLNVNFTCNDLLEDPSDDTKTYRSEHALDYPVNVGRMIAREEATTTFVFVADIELYPSPGLIAKFLQMIAEQGILDKTVYVTPIFEISEHARKLPKDKPELTEMITNDSVIVFHKNFCPSCHTVPKYKEWLQQNASSGLGVFHIAKRTGNWEPIYLGTNEEPPYDERLSWEGRMDKMTQVLMHFNI